MKINYKSFNLPFHYPFTISKGTKTHQPTFVVQLEQFGLKGYGEAPAIAYYNITVDKMIEDLEKNGPLLKNLLLQILTGIGIICIIYFLPIPF